MLFREMMTVYCQNGERLLPEWWQFTARMVSVYCQNGDSLLPESYETHKYTVLAKFTGFEC
jgi:hypothetical protein